jgi:hypothetical protein
VTDGPPAFARLPIVAMRKFIALTQKERTKERTWKSSSAGPSLS